MAELNWARLRDAVVNLAQCALREDEELLYEFDSLTTETTAPGISALTATDQFTIDRSLEKLSPDEKMMALRLLYAMQKRCGWRNIMSIRDELAAASKAQVCIGIIITRKRRGLECVAMEKWNLSGDDRRLLRAMKASDAETQQD